MKEAVEKRIRWAAVEEKGEKRVRNRDEGVFMRGKIDSTQGCWLGSFALGSGKPDHGLVN